MKYLLLIVALFSFSCVTVAEKERLEKEKRDAKLAEVAKEQSRIAEDKKLKQEQAAAQKKIDDAAERVKVDADYKAFIRTNKCEKKYWSRYEQANSFQTLADKNKLTPYDVLFGDDYALRNVNAFARLAAINQYVPYLQNDLPEPIDKKHRQEFEDEKQKKANERSVFNTSIKRDYECYKKLK